MTPPHRRVAHAARAGDHRAGGGGRAPGRRHLFRAAGQPPLARIEAQATPIAPADFDRKWQRGKRAATLQWVGYATGGALLAGGSLLYLLGRKPAAPPATPVLVGPFLSSRAAGALLTGQF